MSLLHLIQQQGQWLSFDGAKVDISASRPKLQRAAAVISDFDGAVSDVIALEGSAAHAVALIERRLRSDGLIDSESKILIHKTRTVGAGYQTLFTAVPLDTWQQAYAWAEAQPDHCLLIPSTSLLWHTLGAGQGVVLQSGRRISVLALLKHDILYRSSLAYSDDPDDLAMTVGALAEQIAEDLGRGQDNLDPLSMRWCPVLVPRPAEGLPWADDTLREIFSSRSGLQVTSVPTRLVRDEAGQEYRSGIAWMESVVAPTIAVNPPLSRAAYMAEWGLPLASAASLLFAVALGTLGARWTLSANEADQRSAQLDGQISDTEERIASLQTKQAVPEGFATTLAFVERAEGMNHGIDPVEGLALVREAAAGEVRILRVRIEEPTTQRRQQAANAGPELTEPTLRVDGIVDPSRGTPGMQVPGFVERLRRAGYDPVPLDPQAGAGSRAASGFFSYLLKRTPASAPGAAP